MTRYLVRLVGALVVTAALSGVAPSAALAQEYAFCDPGQVPEFRFGFAQLRAELGATMGSPIECEHPKSENGDTLQQTTTGLAFYRQATNTPTFTDGWRHWGLTAEGLVAWQGESIDPPVAQARPAPSGPRIDDRLLPAWRELLALEIGQTAQNTLTSQGVSVRVGNLGRPEYLAGYSPWDRLIVFNQSTLAGEEPRALAAVLAHEITHVAQVAEGRHGRGEAGCLAREAEAVIVEATVWEAFWSGYGPDRTRLSGMLNQRLRIYREHGARGVDAYVLSSPGWRAQCSRHAG